MLIALGAVIGKFLTESGGADEIVDTILSKTPAKRLAWAMAAAAFLIGIPLFFEVGVVLLIPIVLLVAKRAKVPVILALVTLPWVMCGRGGWGGVRRG